MGTWQLVKKPHNAMPIANKWVFTKKQDKLASVKKNLSYFPFFLKNIHL